MALDTTLILIGVGCIIGAIIGGGVKLVQVELRPVASLWRQLMLGIFGAMLVLSGIIVGGYLPRMNSQGQPISGSNSQSEVVATGSDEQRPLSEDPQADSAKPSAGNSLGDAGGVAAVDQAPNRPSLPSLRPALPSKVDIFWCVTDGGGAENRSVAEQVAPALRATNMIGRIRVRPLQQFTNAGASYQIFRDIVRFDPNERSGAEEIARIATQAAGISFQAAPALPGSPSIDYLSVFVCAPR